MAVDAPNNGWPSQHFAPHCATAATVKFDSRCLRTATLQASGAPSAPSTWWSCSAGRP